MTYIKCSVQFFHGSLDKYMIGVEVENATASPIKQLQRDITTAVYRS